MKSKGKEPTEASLLRQKSERQLLEKKSVNESSLTAGFEYNRSEADILKLLHELEVHQTELELQNEELRLARDKAETAANKFTAIYDFAPVGYFTLSNDGTIRELNLNGARMLGKERSELINGNFRLFVSYDSRPAFNEFLKKAVETNSKQTTEVRLTIPGNPAAYLHLEGITADEEQECLVTAIDITEHQKAEQALKDSEVLLRELNATKDKFFSIIAHDLRSPFNCIIGFSNMLAERIREKDYEEVEEYAGFIQDSSWQVMDLLMNLIEWSRSQTGRMEINPEEIDMIALINEITVLSIDIALQKSITITKELPASVIVMADKAMISTIVRNLISNAIKFTHPGGAIIIAAEQKPDELIVSISDNGVGINKESIDKLFRIEESLSTIGTQDEKGTGLGLLLCKEFILKHNGKIWVESEPGKGSRFFFTLPNHIN